MRPDLGPRMLGDRSRTQANQTAIEAAVSIVIRSAHLHDGGSSISLLRRDNLGRSGAGLSATHRCPWQSGVEPVEAPEVVFY
jgi:hypothetical protein